MTMQIDSTGLAGPPPSRGAAAPLADPLGIRPPLPVRLPVMRGPVTAESLAKTLGLSRATVSIVLRGDAERRKISADTTRRVLEAARQHNYIPNQTARVLRRQRTDIVGVILPDFRLDWAERVMDGMFEVLAGTPISPFVAIHRFSPELFRKEALAALQRRDDAIVCYPVPGMEDVFDQIRAIGIPLIFIGDRPVHYEHANWVVWDSGEAAKVAVRHLIDQGCRRIGFLSMDFSMRMSQARVKAYRTVLEEAGLPVDERWISMPPSTTPLTEIIEGGLDKIFAGDGPKPDGLFVLNDGTALPALDSLHRRGIRVPDDLKLVAMGDVPLASQSCIGLSTMREPLREMGRDAAEEVLRCIAEPRRPYIQRVITCNELRQRLTTVGSRWNGDA